MDIIGTKISVLISEVPLFQDDLLSGCPLRESSTVLIEASQQRTRSTGEQMFLKPTEVRAKIDHHTVEDCYSRSQLCACKN